MFVKENDVYISMYICIRKSFVKQEANNFRPWLRFTAVYSNKEKLQQRENHRHINLYVYGENQLTSDAPPNSVTMVTDNSSLPWLLPDAY